MCAPTGSLAYKQVFPYYSIILRNLDIYLYIYIYLCVHMDTHTHAPASNRSFLGKVNQTDGKHLPSTSIHLFFRSSAGIIGTRHLLLLLASCLRTFVATAGYCITPYWTRLQVGVKDKKQQKQVWTTTMATPLSFEGKVRLGNLVAAWLLHEHCMKCIEVLGRQRPLNSFSQIQKSSFQIRLHAAFQCFSNNPKVGTQDK